MAWTVISTPDFRSYRELLDDKTAQALADRIALLKYDGPNATRPYFDRLKGSRYPNLKEMVVTKPAHRVLFIFDPSQNAVLLLGGDKSGDYAGWYEEHIPLAEGLYAKYLQDPTHERYEEE